MIGWGIEDARRLLKRREMRSMLDERASVRARGIVALPNVADVERMRNWAGANLFTEGSVEHVFMMVERDTSGDCPRHLRMTMQIPSH
jgi:hypothetical protein